MLRDVSNKKKYYLGIRSMTTKSLGYLMKEEDNPCKKLKNYYKQKENQKGFLPNGKTPKDYFIDKLK